MPRAQNAHAYVNAGFFVQFSVDKRVHSARLCFGGISPTFTRAWHTEKLLVGQDLYNDDTLQFAFSSLEQELICNEDPTLASTAYRKRLAIGLFYKFVLATGAKDRVALRMLSGGEYMRPSKFSSGTQIVDTVEKNWPVTKPVNKYEAMIQVAGELEFVNDLPKQPNELWAAYVSATQVHAKLGAIDASKALVSFF